MANQSEIAARRIATCQLNQELAVRPLVGVSLLQSQNKLEQEIVTVALTSPDLHRSMYLHTSLCFLLPGLSSPFPALG